MADDLDGVLLYRVAAGQNSGSPAVPRIDLVSRHALLQLVRVLGIFFPSREKPWLVFTPHNGYIELPAQLVDGVYPSVADLLDDLDLINSWLHEWAFSDKRTADHRPGWALRRQIESETVRRIAYGLAHEVAQSGPTEIWLRTRADRAGVMRLPPRPQLVPPAPPIEQEFFGARLREAWRTTIAVTSTGTPIYIVGTWEGLAHGEKATYSIPYELVRRTRAFGATLVSPSGTGQ